jgi:hypothetical protein
MVIVSLALSACLAASGASAGRIFGDIKLDGKPVPAGISLNIAVVPPPGVQGVASDSATIVADSTTTDKFGSYKLNVKKEGRCVLTLLYGKQAPTLEVFSYKDATRYDLVLENKDGKLSLRRK